MNDNFRFSDINQGLPVLLKSIFSNGHDVGSRNGRCMELTHIGVTLRNPLNREIVLPARKASIAAQIAESMWVLAGRDDIGWLSHYLPRAADFSDDGKTWRGAYGPRLRNYRGVDQVAYVIDLLRRDPMSRRAVIGIYDGQLDAVESKDIPCNDFLMFTDRLGYLDLHVVVRSNDVIWGWSGINAFEWSVLQELVAHCLGVNVGQLHFSVASMHLYEPHFARAQSIMDADPMPSWQFTEPTPRLHLGLRALEQWDNLSHQWFELEEEIRSGLFDESDVEKFPEPMLRSWLQVLAWWWTGDRMFLSELKGTQLAAACDAGIQPQLKEDRFLAYVVKLHADKDAAYGDSWKRRGEMLGILANIARKVDRLEGGKSTDDEVMSDTAVDLLVYLAKYKDWLDHKDFPGHLERVQGILQWLTNDWAPDSITLDQKPDWIKDIVFNMTKLEKSVVNDRSLTAVIVDEMLSLSYRLAIALW